MYECRRFISRFLHKTKITFKSIGSVSLHLDKPLGLEPILVELDIAIIEIPPLLRLEDIERERLTPDVTYNGLAKRRLIQHNNKSPIYI